MYKHCDCNHVHFQHYGIVGECPAEGCSCKSCNCPDCNNDDSNKEYEYNNEGDEGYNEYDEYEYKEDGDEYDDE